MQPFVKFLLTTFAVWAPGEILRPDLRYALLMFLDVVGKWALLQFLMIAMVMTMHSGLTFELPLEGMRGGGPPMIHTVIEVMPKEGMLYFTLPYLLSCGIATFVLHAHTTLDVVILKVGCPRRSEHSTTQQARTSDRHSPTKPRHKCPPIRGQARAPPAGSHPNAPSPPCLSPS